MEYPSALEIEPSVENLVVTASLHLLGVIRPIFRE